MANLTVSLTVPHASGLPRDAIVNTFAFSGTDTAGDMGVTITSMLTTLYNTTLGGTRLTNYMSPRYGWSTPVIRGYDISHAKPRQPVFEARPEWAGAGSTAPMAEEVAVCLSFRGDLVSGQPPARRRGRVYLGPLNTSGISSGTSIDPVPSAGLLSRAVLGASNVIAAGTAACRWSVWSRADGLLYPVVTAWADNAFDTQRSRGRAPTSRVVPGE